MEQDEITVADGFVVEVDVGFVFRSPSLMQVIMGCIRYTCMRDDRIVRQFPPMQVFNVNDSGSGGVVPNCCICRHQRNGYNSRHRRASKGNSRDRSMMFGHDRVDLSKVQSEVSQ